MFLISMTVCLFFSQGITLDVHTDLELDSGPKPLVRVSADRVYFANARDLQLLDLQGNAIAEFSLDQSTLAQIDPNRDFYIMGFTPLGKDYSDMIYLSIGGYLDGQKVTRGLLLDHKAQEIGLVYDPTLLDPRQVYLRDLYSLGGGSLVANTYQLGLRRGQHAISLYAIRFVPPEPGEFSDLDGWAPSFKITYDDDQPLLRRFFEDDSPMKDYKKVYVDRDPSTGSLMYMFPYEHRVHFLSQEGSAFKAAGWKDLELPGFEDTPSDTAIVTIKSEIVGFVAGPSGPMVAYKANEQSMAVTSQALQGKKANIAHREIELVPNEYTDFAGVSNQVAYVYKSDGARHWLEKLE